MLLHLWLPIVLSAAVLFVISAVSWMVIGLHYPDFRKLPRQDEFAAALGQFGLQPGVNYMFPYPETRAEAKSPEFQRRCNEGPSGTIAVYPKTSMGRNLALTFAYYLFVSYSLAYVATLGLLPGTAFSAVFRFVASAAVLALFAAMIPQAIWFRQRITGHLIEGLAGALAVGAVFGALWPAA